MCVLESLTYPLHASLLNLTTYSDYIEEGNPKAKVIFLFHGFPDLWFGWRKQIQFLATKGYHVIAIDNLGHGETVW